MILLDVGSTNTSAWRIDDGVIVERRTAAVGVRDSATSGTTSLVQQTVADLIDQLRDGRGDVVVAAAGMITSGLGLREVPHVVAPASAEDLASAAVVYRADNVPAPVWLVPGVRTMGGTVLASDVMRGEETLVVGLLRNRLLEPGESLLNAGSHWKLIATDAAGRIAGSRTSLGGEVVHAVQSSTVLTASLPSGPLATLDAAWVDNGAQACRSEGFFRATFAVRLMDQQQHGTPDQRLAWLVGAAIAEDLRGLTASRALTTEQPVVVSGPGAIPAAWVHLLNGSGCPARALDAASVEASFVAGLSHLVGLRG